ncbi:MAG: metalloregulator ArsR/SmtB family transcription factor [Acidimicrobiia bacterium]|nr:metalloregulator ArsR/SmtB family transcription factor [Acidimicrobiia bacterium]
MAASQFTALGDAARWRIVEVLASQPRSVGVVAQLIGRRQPQATKHLQRLERAGLASSRRSAQRHYYILDPEPLRTLAAALEDLAETVDANKAEFDTLEEYIATVDSERQAANRQNWADERTFEFERLIPAPRDVVWRHLTQTELLAEWWAPRSLRLSNLVFDASPGGRIFQEYVEKDDADGSAGVIGRAEGTVIDVDPPSRLRFGLSPLLSDGTVAFTGHYDIGLRDEIGATALHVSLRIADSTIDSADFIAGIRNGWDESLDKLVAAVSASNVSTNSPLNTKENM